MINHFPVKRIFLKISEKNADDGCLITPGGVDDSETGNYKINL